MAGLVCNQPEFRRNGNEVTGWCHSRFHVKVPILQTTRVLTWSTGTKLWATHGTPEHCCKHSAVTCLPLLDESWTER